MYLFSCSLLPASCSLTLNPKISMKNPILLLSEDLLNLFYPRLCPACSTAGLPMDLVICLDCQVHLPYTRYPVSADNPFSSRFWGRIPLVAGTALLSFSKGGRVQHLLHQLKYRGRQDVGIYLGKVLGAGLRKAPAMQDVELILPIPLHSRRLKERGYNQSACFAQGLSESMGVPWSADFLVRTRQTATQTRKSRLERMENVAQAFEVLRPDDLAHKHVLLVDDVLTTGATLETCGELLLQVPGLRLSLAAIAIAAE
jgi:ComF family protein